MPERGRCWTIHDGIGHRFLTPLEVERLFGFPDGYTDIDWYQCCGIRFAASLGKYGCANCLGEKTARLKTAPDVPRYKALGNSWTVPSIRWIGERIQITAEIAQVAA